MDSCILCSSVMALLESDSEGEVEQLTGSGSVAPVAVEETGEGNRTAVIGVPLVLSAVGFTAAGIAAGSLAAKMMSVAAIANGGGVAAGSIVALGQSAGQYRFSIFCCCCRIYSGQAIYYAIAFCR
uniref:Uncharacterized protein n=1 Tax=Laticauda laticaudata TaxID=8630 RepID=A0A8C5SX38_LATLA